MRSATSGTRTFRGPTGSGSTRSTKRCPAWTGSPAGRTSTCRTARPRSSSDPRSHRNGSGAGGEGRGGCKQEECDGISSGLTRQQGYCRKEGISETIYRKDYSLMAPITQPIERSLPATQVSAPPTGRILSKPLRGAVALTAAIDLMIGLAFLFGPEIGLTLWPSPIAPVLMRFIGAIVLGNGVGAALIARRGSWESARVLFAVALVYGIAVLLALLYHLLVVGGAAPVFRFYVAVDAGFLIPIAAVFWMYERS